MKRAIHTTLSHAGRGAFPQALAAGPLIFVSEKGSLSPQKNQPNTGAFDDQVRQTSANVDAIFRADGLGLEYIGKITVDIFDLANVQAFNQACEQLRPARTRTRVD